MCSFFFPFLTFVRCFYNSSFFFLSFFFYPFSFAKIVRYNGRRRLKREFFRRSIDGNHADCARDFSRTNDPRSYYCHFAKSGTRHGFFGLEIFSTAGFALPRGDTRLINKGNFATLFFQLLFAIVLDHTGITLWILDLVPLL